MVNEALFTQKVEDNGVKYNYLSQKLGITPYGLIKKRKGLIPFKVCEINILSEILHLTAQERDEIFDLKSSK